MQLVATDVERFYALWIPLIRFVNQRLHLVPELPTTEPLDPRLVLTIRDALWADDSQLQAFVAENPATLSPEDLAIVASWKHRKTGQFYILRHLQKYSIFIEAKKSEVFGVIGLQKRLEEIVPFVPSYVNATLLPFQDRIIYDSLITSYNIHFGGGIRRWLDQTYKDAKERSAIITSLVPPSVPISSQEQQETDRTTNKHVLDAFRTHLFRAGSSVKVVERDLANATVFAEGYLLEQPEPRWLREFLVVALREYLALMQANGTIKETRRREMLTSLKRFMRFLRDTQRMDYDTAEDALETLKEKKP